MQMADTVVEVMDMQMMCFVRIIPDPFSFFHHKTPGCRPSRLWSCMQAGAVAARLCVFLKKHPGCNLKIKIRVLYCNNVSYSSRHSDWC